MEKEPIIKKHTTDKFSELRERAEKIIQTIETTPSELPVHDIRKVIEELNIHQIELEIQNEELRETRDKLETSHAYMNSLFTYAPVGYITLTKDGTIREINQTAAQYFGQLKEMMAGEQLDKFVSSDYLMQFQGALQNATAFGTPQRCDIQFPAKNNRGFWSRLDMICLDSQKEDPLILCAIHDIELEKEAEGVLQNAKNQLEQMVEERTAEFTDANEQLQIKIREKEIAQKQAEIASVAKSEFLSTVSHEIRTPLNGVMGMLQLLRISALDDKQNEYVEDALTAGRTLLVILNDILDISRIEAGRTVLKEVEFELLRILDTVFKAFQQKADKKGITFGYEIDNAVPRYLSGDTARIRQILFNLVGNAVKFTFRGKIWVEVSLLPIMPGQGEICLYFSVSDTGIGISDDKLALVFDPFTQADGSYTRKFEGTGLGLTVVRRLIQMMHGTLAVETEQGEGTTIHFTVRVRTLKPLQYPDIYPCSQTQFGNREETGIQGSLVANGKPLKIILAEDNWINQLMLRKLLKKQGHRVLVVPSGKSLLEALQTDRFDLILMDIQLPETDGIQATRKIRNGEVGSVAPNIPIIAITAYAMEEDKEEFLNQGINGYISKPIDVKDLKAVIERVMGEAEEQKNEQSEIFTSDV